MTNNTKEAIPASPPRDLTMVKNDDKPQSITLNWQPPKFSNGQIIGNRTKKINKKRLYSIIFLYSFFSIYDIIHI